MHHFTQSNTGTIQKSEIDIAELVNSDLNASGHLFPIPMIPYHYMLIQAYNHNLLTVPSISD